ncbi:unnamed protein product [Spirodela intermedia]|uniref:Uncharacterized protein n=2 Tax=Spirodela intermedia TaxID=51605 RepID=A0A7I8J2A1_SPIIN|nr:unnamed protein product [Spirodela intermedia]CAA6664267.1 unnamed protein product [Spirodela intermedia]CAA7400821.1 unnamed protein product [Spirodela intermedia]
MPPLPDDGAQWRRLLTLASVELVAMVGLTFVGSVPFRPLILHRCLVFALTSVLLLSGLVHATLILLWF